MPAKFQIYVFPHSIVDFVGVLKCYVDDSLGVRFAVLRKQKIGASVNLFVHLFQFDQVEAVVQRVDELPDVDIPIGISNVVPDRVRRVVVVCNINVLCVQTQNRNTFRYDRSSPSCSKISARQDFCRACKSS